MADQETHPSPAKQRMRAVAKLKRAPLVRMKDGRRPPMHVEAMSEGEKAPSEEEKAVSGPEELETPEEDLTVIQRIQGRKQALEKVNVPEGQEKASELDSDHPLPTTQNASDVDLESDTELEEPALSLAAIFKKRRTRVRSRGSKDFKAKLKAAAQPPFAPLGGDSSPDENPPVASPVILPMIPPLLSPIPHFPFLQPSRFLRSPTAGSPEMSLFYPGTSPPTPLPTLEEIQKGLMRSNSAGSSAAGRRMAMHKLTGGETYEPSPSPTTSPSLPKFTRNNTVAGGERIAARQHMLSRLGTRITLEADAEGASGTEDRGAPSPAPKRGRRRSRRTSVNAAVSSVNGAVSDSDFNSNSTKPNTPAFPPTPLPTLLHHFSELRAQSTTPNQLSGSRTQSSERISDTIPRPLPNTVIQQSEDEEEVEPERPEQTRRRSVLIGDDEEREPPNQRYAISPLPGTPQRTFQTVEAIRLQDVSDIPSNASLDSVPAPGVDLPVFSNQRAPSKNETFSSSPFMTPLKEKPLNDEDEEQVLYSATHFRPRTPDANMIDNYEREISWIASPVPEIRMPIDDDNDDEPGQEVDVQEAEPEDEEAPLSTVSSNGFSPETFDRDEHDDVSPRASSSSKSVLVESETSPDVPYVLTSDPSASQAVLPRPSEDSGSPQFYPTRLSSTTWEKVKNTFSRAGSRSGRRSRTNSIARERRDHTDSSISRESGASLLSTKTDKGESGPSVGQPQAPPLMQSNPSSGVGVTAQDLTGFVARDSEYAAHGGGYADVYKGVLQMNARSTKVAIKVLRAHIYGSTNQWKINKRLNREIRLWSGLRHPNIVPLLGITQNFGPHVAMVCPWMNDGNLNHYLDKRKAELNLQKRLQILVDVVEGLTYLHQKSIVHGDLTSANVLMDGGKAHLTDFGLSNVMADIRNASLLTSTVGGAPRWTAPELIMFDKEATTGRIADLTKQCDIYSFGSVALQVISGKIPYANILSDYQVLVEIIKGSPPHRPPEPLLSDAFWGLIISCLGREPSTRPEIDQVQETLQILRYDCSKEELAANIVDSDMPLGTEGEDD